MMFPCLLCKQRIGAIYLSWTFIVSTSSFVGARVGAVKKGKGGSRFLVSDTR